MGRVCTACCFTCKYALQYELDDILCSDPSFAEWVSVCVDVLGRPVLDLEVRHGQCLLILEHDQLALHGVHIIGLVASNQLFAGPYW
jgi:hypothetical protein